jgi:hypothetical protein
MKKMKNILLLIMFISVFIKTDVTAQCENQVSTNPQNAYNSALPDLQSSGIPYAYDYRYENGFDWINGNDVLDNKEYKLTNMMYNPTQPYGNMANIQDPLLVGYYKYLNKDVLKNEEMNTQNGWELMLVNLGKYPDDVTEHSLTTLNVVPYLVFYNRYRGVLRVFVQYGYNQPPTNSINGVKIDLFYEKEEGVNVSGVLRLAEGKDRSLDQETNVLKMTTFAPKIAQQVFWMSADFQLAFDPCVCDFASHFFLSFTFFTEQDFKLYGRAISVEEDLPIEGTEIQDKGFLSNVDYSSGTGDNGLIIYNKMEDLIEDYIRRMEDYNDELIALSEHNEEVQKNIKIARAVITVIKFTVAGAVGTPAVLALQGDLAIYFFDDQSEKGKKAVENLFKKMEELLGKEMDTWVSKNFKPKTAPAAPEAPTAVFTEMRFDGDLISQTPVLGPVFHTPGSFVNRKNPNTGVNDVLDLPIQAVYGYPVYNNPTGIFALLEKPKIQASRTLKNSSTYKNLQLDELDDNMIGAIYGRNYSFQNWTNEYQFQLENELKYKLNSSLDIKSYDIKVALVVKGKKRLKTSLPNLLQNVFYDYKKIVNLESNELGKILNYKPIWTNSGQFQSGGNFNNLDYPLILPFSCPTPGCYVTDDDEVFQTPYVNVNAFKNVISSLGIINELYRAENVVAGVREGFPPFFYEDILFPIPQIQSYPIEHYGHELDFELELKVIINVVFNTLNSNGENNSTSQIFTYSIDDVLWSDTDINPNLKNSANDFSQYPENLTFTNTNFNGSEVEGCILEGNTYTCQAWNDIIIDGVLTSENGYQVNIFAGNNIEELPESDVSPEIVLDIKQILDFSHPMPEATPAYVSNFCDVLNQNANSYQANVPNGKLSKQLAMQDSINALQNTITNEPFDFTLYPNPTSSQTRIALENTSSTEIEVSVIDIMGKLIHVDISQINEKIVSLNVAGLEKGIYFVKVKSNFEEKTKQLVVN